MQIICDGCNNEVKKVGRLTNVKWSGISQKLCKGCRDTLKKRFR